MFNHGITTGALFLAVGQLYDRTHSRLIGDYGGLHKPMPRFAAFLCLFSVAAFGLPGAANFIGEFLVLVGTSYRSFLMVLLAMGGIVLAAAYMLWMLQRVTLGQAATRAAALLPDLSLRETVTLAPLAILILWVGLYPGPLMEMMDASVTHLVQKMNGVLPLKLTQTLSTPLNTRSLRFSFLAAKLSAGSWTGGFQRAAFWSRLDLELSCRCFCC